MSRHRKLEEKRKQRQLRMRRGQSRHEQGQAVENAIAALRDVQRAMKTPRPRMFPGAVDGGVAEPDLLKLQYVNWVQSRSQFRTQCRDLERRYRQGPLCWLPEIEHWALEEFLWHGTPGSDRPPLEAWLDACEGRFSPEALEQLRLWDGAEFGIYRLGDVRDDLVQITPLDEAGRDAGESARMISLNIGGVNIFRGRRGRLLVSFVAPWRPEHGICCGMGFSMMVPPEKLNMVLPLLLLRDPARVGTPFPWNESWKSKQEWLAVWRARDWYRWFGEQLTFPFDALVSTPDGLHLGRAERLTPMSPQEVEQLGIYFEVPQGDEMLICGATGLRVWDPRSPNFRALEEYHAYRAEVGPPPGMIGRPTYLRLR